MKATSITCQTLVGTWGEFPRDHGNCFSMMADDGHEYKIVNAYAENLEYLLEKGVCGYPIHIKAIGTHTAVLEDRRIPKAFLRGDYCEICCPHGLLPFWQRLRTGVRRRWDLLTGRRTEHRVVMDDGTPMVVVSYKIKARRRELKTTWARESALILSSGSVSANDLFAAVEKELLDQVIVPVSSEVRDVPR